MKKSTEALIRQPNGFAYIESIFAAAVICICALILQGSLVKRQIYQAHAEHRSRAMAALVSQADLIRAGKAPLTPGKHNFVLPEKLLQGLPSARGSYTVSPAGNPGLLLIRLDVSWDFHGAHGGSLKLYVHS